MPVGDPLPRGRKGWKSKRAQREIVPSSETSRVPLRVEIHRQGGAASFLALDRHHAGGRGGERIDRLIRAGSQRTGLALAESDRFRIHLFVRQQARQIGIEQHFSQRSRDDIDSTRSRRLEYFPIRWRCGSLRAKRNATFFSIDRMSEM